MEKWHFLDPWLGRLCLHSRRFPKHDVERRGSIAPHSSILIWLSSDADGQVARALELVALAIRVDDRVWEKLRVAYCGNIGGFKRSRYRPDDLKLHVEAMMDEHSSLVEYFDPMAIACDADQNGPTSVAAYLDARHRVSQLDVGRRLCRFQIPLTLSLEPGNVKAAAECVTKLEALVASGRVAIRGAIHTSSDHDPRALFIVEAVKIEPTTSSNAEFLLNRCGPKSRVLGCPNLDRLRALGLPITTAAGRVEDDSQFLDWMARDRALTLALLVGSNAELQRVYEIGCRFHERLTALTLCLCVDDLDASLAATVLSDLPRKCPSLRAMEVIDNFQSDVWVALDNALGGMTVPQTTAHLHPVRAFSLVLLADELPRRTITALAQWLPRLKSLTLRQFGRHRSGIDDACIGPVLQAFPLLEALDVRHVRLTTWRDLLDAYDTHDCRIRTLALWDDSPSCIPLLEALGSPTRRIAHALNELEICTSSSGANLPEAEAMLQANRRLDCFRLRLGIPAFVPGGFLHTQLERFHREPLAKLTRGAEERWLAFLSVVHRAPIRGMHAMDSNVLSLILAMACERLLRLVEVVMGEPYPKSGAEEEFSIAPHTTIRIELFSSAIGQVARALELATLAIRVDEHVWDKLHLEADCHAFDFESSHYRPEDLELHVEASVSSYSSLDQHFDPMVEACDADREGPTSAAAYLDARHRILELDVGRRLRGFLVPLTFSLEPDDGAVQCVAMLERLVSSGRVAICGAAQAPNDHRQAAACVVKAVKIAPTPLFDDRLLYLGRDERSASLTKASSASKLWFLHWMVRDRALKLELLVESNTELRRVYETECRLHERLTSLTLGIYIGNLDASLAAMVLSELPRVCPSLRSVKLLDTFDSAVWDALSEARGAKTDVLPLPQTAVRAHPVRAFTIELQDDVLPRRTIPTLAQWLPRLGSLSLRLCQQHRTPIDDAFVDHLLQAFPLLEALDLRDVHLTTWSDLLDAYETRGCRVRTLSLGDHDLSCVPLLEALACPTRWISRTVRELKIYTAGSDEPNSVRHPAEALLQANRRPDCFRLRTSYDYAWGLRDSLKAHLQRFHREPVDKLAWHRRAVLKRLAFLSVVHRAPIRGMDALDAGVLSHIFTLADGHLLRLVDVF